MRFCIVKNFVRRSVFYKFNKYPFLQKPAGFLQAFPAFLLKTGILLLQRFLIQFSGNFPPCGLPLLLCLMGLVPQSPFPRRGCRQSLSGFCRRLLGFLDFFPQAL